MKFRTPKTSFEIKYKGKKMTVVAQSHASKIGEMWGAQALCPWGCNVKFIVTRQETPREVAEEMQRAVRTHYHVSHSK